MALLIMINERPMTGYGVMRLMREITEGHWKPTPGGVYPVLKRLEVEGLVKGEWSSEKGRRRKEYVITDEGRHTLDKVLLKQSEIAFGINRLFDSFLKGMFSVENPRVAPSGILTILLSQQLPDEAETLEERRDMVSSLLESLQHVLSELDERIEAEKKRAPR